MKRMHLRYRLLAAPIVVMLMCAIAAVLLACTATRRQPQNIPRHVTFMSSGDTIYGTTGDPVQFCVFSTLHWSYPWGEPQPEPDYHVDFGDGTPSRRADRLRDRISANHLYSREGTYHAVIWAERKDSVIASDTIPIILRDYVRPSQARRISVSIAGVEIVLFNLVERPGVEDSTFLTRIRDFTHTYPNHMPDSTSQFLDWEATQHWSTRNTKEERFASYPRDLDVGYISLSADGTSIKTLQIIYKDRQKEGGAEKYIYTGCQLQNIPLDSTQAPMQHTAVYKVHCPASAIEQYVQSISLSRSYQTEDATTRSWVLHTSPYSDVTITVEFTK